MQIFNKFNVIIQVYFGFDFSTLIYLKLKIFQSND